MSPRTKKDLEPIRHRSMEKITEAALELFGNEGYHATSVSKIASKAGVSKGLIYNYFDSKEQILMALLTDVDQESQDLLEDLFRGKPEEQLRKVIDYLFVMMRTDFRRVKLFLSLVAQVENIAFVQRLGVEKYRRTMAILEKLFTDLRYHNPKAEAQFITALVDGLAMQYAILNDELPLSDIQNNLYERYHIK